MADKPIAFRMTLGGRTFEALASWERVGEQYESLSDASVLLPAVNLKFSPNGSILLGASFHAFPGSAPTYDPQRIADALRGDDGELVAVTFVFAPVSGTDGGTHVGDF